MSFAISCSQRRRSAPWRHLGKIYICNVDEVDGERIQALLEKIPAGFRGAMGTSAKVMAEKCGISMDFTYGVIDKCILKALIGKNSYHHDLRGNGGPLLCRGSRTTAGSQGRMHRGRKAIGTESVNLIFPSGNQNLK